MRIGNTEIGSSGNPYIIAEIGVNHDGSESRASQLIDEAASAGADAVKFQYFTAERLVSRAARLAAYQVAAGATDSFSLLRSLELPLHVITQLAHHAKSVGLDPIVTVFSIEHVCEMQHIPWHAFKVSSPDIINRPLIERLCTTGKPVILSTGAARVDEIGRSVSWVGKHPFALMQCVSAYPTPIESAQLGVIGLLRETFQVAVGYSDHTSEVLTGGVAVAAGAVILEKHLTLNRSAKGPDHAASLDPSGFRKYVEFARSAAMMLGERVKRVLSIEKDVRELSRQSIVTTRSVTAGTILQREDLTIKRPGGGICPARLNDLVGCPVAVDVDADLPLMERHLRRTADLNPPVEQKASSAWAA